MKILAVAFWTIVLVILAKVVLRVGLFVFPWFLPADAWASLEMDSTKVFTWITPAYSVAIGYILWLFREKKWIIWSSYAYLISFVLVLTLKPGEALTFRYVAYLTLVDLPCALGGVSWLFVRTRPIAPYYWVLAATYLGGLLFVDALSFLYVETHAIVLEYVVLVIDLLLPVPTLFLIARARRWIRENRALELEVGAM